MRRFFSILCVAASARAIALPGGLRPRLAARAEAAGRARARVSKRLPWRRKVETADDCEVNCDDEKEFGSFAVTAEAPVAPAAQEPLPKWRTDYLGSLDRLGKYSDDGFTLSTPLRYSSGDWWRHVLSMRRSLILKRVRGHVSFNILWSCAVAGAYTLYPRALPLASLKTPFDLSGGILGILLAFRTSQACTRFWHGREIWATVIHKIRSFGRALIYLDDPSDETLDAYFRWLEAYPECLKQHLRGERDIAALTMLNNRERDFIDATDNMPVGCTLALSALLNRLKADKNEQSAKHLLWWQLEGELLHKLMGCVGEAEAIAGTPVPLSYSRHTSRLTSLWTFSMPLVLVTCLPIYAVPVVTGLVSWTLLATEEISHLIEEPFGLHDDRPNMLPLNRYCAVIAADLANIRENFDNLRDYESHADDKDEMYEPLYTSSPGVGGDKDAPEVSRPVYDPPLYPGFTPREDFDPFKAAKEVQADPPLYPGFAPREGFVAFREAKEAQAEPNLYPGFVPRSGFGPFTGAEPAPDATSAPAPPPKEREHLNGKLLDKPEEFTAATSAPEAAPPPPKEGEHLNGKPSDKPTEDGGVDFSLPLFEELQAEDRPYVAKMLDLDASAIESLPADEREQVEGLRKMYEMQAWKKKADGIAAPSAPTWTASRPFA
jgi:predicted membrane chloride channel (bestrophin family)